MTELDKYLLILLGAAYLLAQPSVLLFCIWKQRRSPMNGESTWPK